MQKERLPGLLGKKTFFLLNNQRGQAALILVVFMTTAIFLVGSAALAMGTTVRKNAVYEVNQKKAYYIAEAGVEKGILSLLDDLVVYPPEGSDGEYPLLANEDYAKGVIETVDIKRETVGEDVFYTIKSTGRYPETVNNYTARKTLEVKIKAYEHPFLSFGGPGVKSEKGVELQQAISATKAALVAKNEDVGLLSVLSSGEGDVYAGRDIGISQFLGSGKGTLKAGRDVVLSGLISSWTGDIWAGGEVKNRGWFNYINGTIHEHANPIPGFPIPPFPEISKSSPWYNALYQRAVKEGRFYATQDDFYEKNLVVSFGNDNILFNWHPYIISVQLTLTKPPELNLDGLYLIIDGKMELTRDKAKSFYDQKVAEKKQERIDYYQKLGYQNVYIYDPLSLTINVNYGDATIVADTIELNDTGGSLFSNRYSGNKPMGLFAVGQDQQGDSVKFNNTIAEGKEMCVLAQGKVKFSDYFSRNHKFRWIVSKDKIDITQIFSVISAQAGVPPGTPGGYRIIGWQEK